MAAGWTESEEDAIRNRGDKTYAELAKDLGRTKTAIRKRAKLIGSTRKPGRVPLGDAKKVSVTTAMDPEQLDEIEADRRDDETRSDALRRLVGVGLMNDMQRLEVRLAQPPEDWHRSPPPKGRAVMVREVNNGDTAFCHSAGQGWYLRWHRRHADSPEGVIAPTWLARWRKDYRWRELPEGPEQ